MFSKVDFAASKLRGRILAGEYAVGERLPPERELAPELGIHRLTLRTALDRLKLERLVESRQGSGYKILDYREWGGPSLLPQLSIEVEGEDWHRVASDMLKVRRLLAQAVLERISEGIEPQARQEIADAVTAFAAVVNSEERVLVGERDLEIVRALLRATGSQVFALCFNPISHAVRSNTRMSEAIYAQPTENLAGWQALVSWLDAPNAEQIPMLMAAMEARDADTLTRLKQ